MSKILCLLGALVGTVVLSTVAVESRAAPAQAPGPAARTQLAAIKDAFETDGLLGGNEAVLVQAMVESETGVSLRARQAGLEPTSLRAKTYGLKLYVVYEDAEIGTAFLHRIQVYHLGSRNDQLTVDDTYYYCTGFLSADIVKVTEKSWEQDYSANPSDLTRLDTLAEAVRSGSGYREAFGAVDPISGLLRTAGQQRNLLERDFTWFSGRQAIEGVGIELMRSREFGNRVSVRFVQ